MTQHTPPDPGTAPPGLFESFVLVLLCLGVLGISLPLLPESMDSNLFKLLVLVMVAGLLFTITFARMAWPGLTVPRGLTGVLAASLSAAVYTAARVMSNPFTGMSLSRLFIVLSCTAVFLAITVLDGKRSGGRVLLVIVCAGAPALLVSALMGTGVSVGLGLPVTGFIRNPGTLGNANLLGSYSAALLLPGMLLVSRSSVLRTGKTAGLILFSALCCIPLVQSGTRASPLALGATLAFFAAFASMVLKRSPEAFPDGRRTFSSVLTATLLVLCVSLLVDGRWRSLSLSGGTAGVRLVIWRGAFDMFLARPFTGWGEGTFQAIFPLFRSADYALRGVTSNTIHAHGEIIELAAESGFAGLSVWGALFILWCRKVLSRWRRWTVIDLAALSGVVFLLLESFVSVSLRWSSSTFLLAVFAAVPLGGPEEQRVRMPRVLSVVPLIGAVFLLAFGVPTVMKMIRSSRHLYSAVNSCLEMVQPTLNDPALHPVQAGDSALALCARAENECRLSLSLCPWDYGSWFTLGNAGLTSASIRALEYPGASLAAAAGVAADLPGALSDVRRALDSYDSLAVRAADFSDLRLNRFHALLKVGDFDEALSELVILHSGRTQYRDYCESVARSISPFTTGCGYDSFNSSVLLARFSGENDPDGRRTPAIASGLLVMLAMNAYESRASSDSLALILAGAMDTLPPALGELFLPGIQSEIRLAGEGEALLARIGSGPDDLLYGISLDAVRNSGAFAPCHRYALCCLSSTPGDPYLQDVMASLNRILVGFAPHRVLAWPGGGDHFILGVRMGLEACPVNMELLEQLFDDAWLMDCFLSSSLSYARGSYVTGSQPALVDSTFQFWVKLGGPSASLASGLRTGLPLVPGGIMNEMLRAVESAAGSHPDSTELRLFLLRQRFRIGSMDFGSRTIPSGREGLSGFDSVMVGLADTLVSTIGPEAALARCSGLLSRETLFLEGITGDPGVSANAAAYRSSLCAILEEAVTNGD